MTFIQDSKYHLWVSSSTLRERDCKISMADTLSTSLQDKVLCLSFQLNSQFPIVIHFTLDISTQIRQLVFKPKPCIRTPPKRGRYFFDGCPCGPQKYIYYYYHKEVVRWISASVMCGMSWQWSRAKSAEKGPNIRIPTKIQQHILPFQTLGLGSGSIMRVLKANPLKNSVDLCRD